MHGMRENMVTGPSQSWEGVWQICLSYKTGVVFPLCDPIPWTVNFMGVPQLFLSFIWDKIAEGEMVVRWGAGQIPSLTCEAEDRKGESLFPT